MTAGLETVSLVVGIGALLSPGVTSSISSLKPSANTLTKMTEERLTEILKQLETYYEMMDQDQVAMMLDSHTRHSLQLEALRRQYPDSFRVKQLWNKYIGTYRQRAEALYTKTNVLHSHVKNASETARVKTMKTKIPMAQLQPRPEDQICVPEPVELSFSRNYFDLPLHH